MVADLSKLIESDRLAAEFYLASDTDRLLRWIAEIPSVLALIDLIASDPMAAQRTAARSLELLRSPVRQGYRSEVEPAICCYAYVLSRSPGSDVRTVLEQFDAEAGPEHGWLRRLLNRLLQHASTNVSIPEAFAPVFTGQIAVSAATPTITVPPYAIVMNNTPFEFDSLTEFWSAEDSQPLKAAA